MRFVIHPQLSLQLAHTPEQQEQPPSARRLPLPPDAAAVQTCLTRNLGPLQAWPWTLYKTLRSNFNFVHLTPVQQLGASRSCYSIHDVLRLAPGLFTRMEDLPGLRGDTASHAAQVWKTLRDAELTGLQGDAESARVLRHAQDIQRALQSAHMHDDSQAIPASPASPELDVLAGTVRGSYAWQEPAHDPEKRAIEAGRMQALKQVLLGLETRGTLAMQDVVLNHASADAPWLAAHPEAVYSCANSPWLRPAFALDEMVMCVSHAIASGGSLHARPAAATPRIHRVHSSASITSVVSALDASAPSSPVPPASRAPSTAHAHEQLDDGQSLWGHAFFAAFFGAYLGRVSQPVPDCLRVHHHDGELHAPSPARAREAAAAAGVPYSLLREGGPVLRDAASVQAVLDVVEHLGMQSARLWEYYVLDVDACVAQLEAQLELAPEYSVNAHNWAAAHVEASPLSSADSGDSDASTASMASIVSTPDPGFALPDGGWSAAVPRVDDDVMAAAASTLLQHNALYCGARLRGQRHGLRLRSAAVASALNRLSPRGVDGSEARAVARARQLARSQASLCELSAPDQGWGAVGGTPSTGLVSRELPRPQPWLPMRVLPEGRTATTALPDTARAWLRHLVETVNFLLYQRYDADIQSAIKAMRGTAEHLWLTERASQGLLSAAQPIVHSYFLRYIPYGSRPLHGCDAAPLACPGSVLPYSRGALPQHWAFIFACNGFIWNGNVRLDFTLPTDIALAAADASAAHHEAREVSRIARPRTTHVSRADETQVCTARQADGLYLDALAEWAPVQWAEMVGTKPHVRPAKLPTGVHLPHTAASTPYMRRDLVAWGDCVKLRYGERPSDSPWLWAYMRCYVQRMASVFPAFRVDNAHGTPAHVLAYMLRAARSVRPELMVNTELFTGSLSLDVEYIGRMGVTSLVREAAQTHSPADLTSYLYAAGGDPAGSLKPPMDHVLSLLGPQPAESSEFARSGAHLDWRTWMADECLPTRVPPLLFDCTHDNPAPAQHRHVANALPTAVAVGMCAGGVGSVRGYDTLVPRNINVVHDERWYDSVSLPSLAALHGKQALPKSIAPELPGMHKWRSLLNALHAGMARAGYTEAHYHLETPAGEDTAVLVIHRSHPTRPWGMLAIVRFAYSHGSAPARVAPDAEPSSPLCAVDIDGTVTGALAAARLYAAQPSAAESQRQPPAGPLATPPVYMPDARSPAQCEPGHYQPDPSVVNGLAHDIDTWIAPGLWEELAVEQRAACDRHAAIAWEPIADAAGGKRASQPSPHTQRHPPLTPLLEDELMPWEPSDASGGSPFPDNGPEGLRNLSESSARAEQLEKDLTAGPISGSAPLGMASWENSTTDSGAAVSSVQLYGSHFQPGSVLLLRVHARRGALLPCPPLAHVVAQAAAVSEGSHADDPALPAATEPSKLSPLRWHRHGLPTAKDLIVALLKPGRVTLDSLNFLLYRAEPEERADTRGADGCYVVPGLGRLQWAGVAGITGHIHAALQSNDLGHPLCAHLREGLWLPEFFQRRMARRPELHAAADWLQCHIRAAHKLPRHTRPQAICRALRVLYFVSVGVALHMLRDAPVLAAAASALQRRGDVAAALAARPTSYSDAIPGVVSLVMSSLMLCSPSADAPLLRQLPGNLASHAHWLGAPAGATGAAWTGAWAAVEDAPSQRMLSGGDMREWPAVASHSGSGSDWGWHVPTNTLAAGVDHFAATYMRNWGRDTFIALRGLLLLTGRWQAALDHILAYASVLRHGLIPNLMDAGSRPRYNARDATWWWAQAVVEYAQLAPEGWQVLQVPVRRLFAGDVPPPAGLAVQTLGSVLTEVLRRHASGIEFREWGAGRAIDAHMTDAGFNVQVGPRTRLPHGEYDETWDDSGLLFGGNVHNCGTWMDKMGESPAFGTDGVPATPRDGAPVEISALVLSVLTALCAAVESDARAAAALPRREVLWLPLDVSDRPSQSELAQLYRAWDDDSVVPSVPAGQVWSWQQWRDALQAGFHRAYWIAPGSVSSVRQACLRDVCGSADAWSDGQLRCNAAVALALVPQVLGAQERQSALHQLERHLLRTANPGMITLDPAERAYRGWYDNSDQTEAATASGFNYHNGPEWLWPTGYYLRAALHGRGEAGSSGGEGATSDTAACVRVKWVLARAAPALHHVRTSATGGLPELTQADGVHCAGSCEVQAWSGATLLDALFDAARGEQLAGVVGIAE